MLKEAKSGYEPTDKKKWESAKAKAKRKFDVYPSAYCVPTYSEALTKEGWKNHSELKVGEEILAYNSSKDILEWSKVRDIHFFPEEKTIRLKKQTLDLECTPNHKWVYYRNSIKPEYKEEKLKKIWKYISSIKDGSAKISKIKKEFSSIQKWNDKYKDCESLDELKKRSKHKVGVQLINAEDLSENGYILATAPFVNDKANFIKTSSKYGQDWIKTILNMSPEQIEAFFMGCVICDGWQVNEKAFGFSQKDNNHADAFELAAFLSGRRTRRRFDKKRNMSFFSIIEKRYIPLTNVSKSESKTQDVWCPETELSTWVMRQNGHVLITGNSNLWASKEYKKMGGKWKKEKKKSKNKRAFRMEALMVIAGGKSDKDMDTLKFVKYHGPYDYEKNEEVYKETERSAKDGDKHCQKIMDRYEGLMNDYLNDRADKRDNGKKIDYNDSDLADAMKDCEEHLEKEASIKALANLRDWVDEEWVRVDKKDKDGDYLPCGRSDADKGSYPKCRPKSKAKNMTKKEKESASRRKREQEKKPRKGKKPHYVSTKSKKKKSSLDIFSDYIINKYSV